MIQTQDDNLASFQSIFMQHFQHPPQQGPSTQAQDQYQDQDQDNEN